MRVYLYKRSDAEFCEMLNAEAIEYKRRPMRPGVVRAAGDGIEIIQSLSDASPWAALAAVLIAWIRSRSTRKAIITTNDNKVVHVEGMSVADVERILEKTKGINVIDTAKEEET